MGLGATDYGLPPGVIYELGISRNRNNGRIQDGALDAYVTELRSARTVPTLLEWAAFAPLLFLDPQSQLEASRRIQDGGGPPQARAAIRLWDGTAWAMRGAWDSALVSLDRLYAERPVLAFAGARFATGVMAYWTGAVERDAALARRRELADHRIPGAAMVAASRLLAFLDGIVAHADRSPAGIDSARAALRAVSNDAAAAWLERALAAFQIDLQGNSAQAADSLLAIERRRGGENVFDYFPVPFIRLLAGRIKAEEGQSALADSLLSYYETGVATVSAQLILKQTAGFAALERGRAWDRAGDADRAARFHREFLRLYDIPPAPHRPYVEDALSALAQLASQADRGGKRNP